MAWTVAGLWQSPDPAGQSEALTVTRMVGRAVAFFFIAGLLVFVVRKKRDKTEPPEGNSGLGSGATGQD